MYNIGDKVIYKDYYNRQNFAGKVIKCNNIKCYIKTKYNKKVHSKYWYIKFVGIPLENIIKCYKPFKKS